MNYWLMKTEPDTFSIQDLRNSPKSNAPWEGVRNYQARNFMQKMKLGDQVLIYHSSCAQIGVAGLAQVSKEAYPDPTAFDSSSEYFDPKSTPEKPRWFMVEVKWLKTFPRIVSLKEIKDNPRIKEIPLVQKGSRLSVMPVSAKEFKIVKELADK